MTATTETYSSRLGITPPKVDDFVGRNDVTLAQLAAVALLERGGPATLDELVIRLGCAGVVPGSGDLAVSIPKSWRGRKPIVREPDGRFALDLRSFELEHLLLELGLRPREPVPAPEPIHVPQRGDAEPLTLDEIDAAFRDRGLYGFAVYRQAAAVLEAAGKPMTVEQVDEFLSALTTHRSKLTERDARNWTNDLIAVAADGQLTLNMASAALVPMRQAVRKIAYPVQVQRARSAAYAKSRAARKEEAAAERVRQATELEMTKRAVIRTFPTGAPEAAVLIDIGSREIRSFVGQEEMSEFRRALASYEVVVGLDVRATLHTLGVDAQRVRVIDLAPPQKSMRINKSGRTLKIDTELLMRSSISVSRPFGDPKKTAAYLRDGDEGKLRRRLESDAKALFHYYGYGRLHGYVRLRWGFLEDVLGVDDWILPGELRLYEILRQAQEQRRAVEMVVGWSAPGWEDPWSRAKTYLIENLGMWSVVARAPFEVVDIPRVEIQAVRLAGG